MALSFWLASLAIAVPGESNPAAELLPPVRIEAAGKAIDTEIGHAAPCVADFNGDSVQDLLVGQFGGGILWMYRNDGTNAEPRLEAGVKFNGTVPTG